MQINRKALVLAAPSLLALTLLPTAAAAHGTMNNPPSRAMVCYSEGPESPKTAACKQAVALGGTQPLYDWNEVNIAAAAGRHRELIPDGKLCSAGRDKYRGFDQARADWPATAMPSGGAFSFTFRATAPHKGTFELYVTKDGYDPAKPLAWSSLEAKPFATKTDPALSNGSYVLDAQLPAKKGRHLIYAIWQRSDSPEAFYSCSDVTFGGTQPTATPTATAKPTATPTATTPTPTAKPTATPTATTTSSPLPSALSVINAGVGVSPATAKVGQPVTVTAVCSGGQVTGVVSNAFAQRKNYAPVPTVAWAPTLTATKAGTHPVTVHCKGGNLARTHLTVTN